MKKRIFSAISFIIIICCLFLLSACDSKVEFKVNFIVDNVTYATINTNGKETIVIPENPQKEGCSFDGWFLDSDTWQKPFTAESLLNAPLSSDMKVYAKFSKTASKHEHSYSVVETEPTCIEQGFTTHICGCGNAYIDSYIPELGHSFTHYASDDNATCTTDGTMTAHCDRKGCSVTDTKTAVDSKLGHDFTDYISNGDGTKTAHCNYNNCEETKTISEDETVHTHSFGEYISDNNATCTTDGTKTACCTYHGCNAVDTIIDAGTKLNHSFTDYTSDNNSSCTTDGTMTAHCNRKGCSATDTKTDINSRLGHDFTYYVSNNDATYEKDGTKTAHCNHLGCTATDTKTDEDSKLLHSGIRFKTLTVNEQNSIYGKVANGTNTFSFLDEVEKVGGATYGVYLDIYCSNEVKSKTVPLETGDNTFYIWAENTDNGDVLYTITIRVKPMYDVAFDTLGGSAIAKQSVEEDGFVAKPGDPTQRGYLFEGWNFNFNTPITTSMTIVANTWMPIQYTFRFDKGSDEATGTMEDQIFTYDIRENLTSNKFERIGYTFAGWKLESTETYFNERQNIKNYSDTDKTEFVLVAQWNANKYKVEFSDGSGYTITATKNGEPFNSGSTVTIEDTLLFSLSAKTGYHLDIDNILRVSGTKRAFTDNSLSRVYEDVTVSGSASVNTYIVHFEKGNNDCFGTMNNQIYTYDEIQKLTKNLFTLTGYSFAGWNLKGTDIILEDEQKITDYSSINGCEIILVAQWVINKYPVRIESTVGGSIRTNITNGNKYDYEKSVSFECISTDLGYEYLGLFDGDRLITKERSYTFNLPSQEINYTAKWKVKDEMSNFTFSSTATTCQISGIIDKTKTVLYIPEYVTYINGSALSGCSELQSIRVAEANQSYHATENCLINTASKILMRGCMNSIIPNDGSVTAINDSAFNGCTGLKNISIPNGVKSIGSLAFCGCSALKSLEIPNSVRSIGKSAFKDCSNLLSINIPDNVTQISIGMLSGCSKLENLTIPFVGERIKTASDTYQYPLGYIFGKDSYTGGAETSQYFYESSTSSPSFSTFYIPASLKSVTVTGGNILRGAFHRCSGLTSICIPESIVSIGDDAFAGCSRLTNITLPSQVTSIGGGAFSGCSSLSKITIPSNVTSIGGRAFSGCSSLSEIIIPNKVTSIGNYAFADCSKLTCMTIPDSVTRIGNSAFSGCLRLKTLTIPFIGERERTANDQSQYPLGYIFGTSSYIGGVATTQSYYGTSTSRTTSETYYIPSELISVTVTGGDILYGAFLNCSGLVNISLPEGATIIGESAFSNCSSLVKITIPNSVVNICEYAFSHCSNLLDITLSNKVTNIGNSAFSYCSSLKNIVIPNNVVDIGFGAFQGCAKLESMTIPFIGNTKDGKTNTNFEYIFGESNYYQQGDKVPTSLKTVVITSGSSIPDYAFYNCSHLKNVTISDSVMDIGCSAFSGCSGLTNVTLPDSVTSIGGSAFNGCSGLTSITIPDDVTKIDSYTFYGCSKLLNATLPDGVISVGSYAFYGCSYLNSVSIPDSVTAIGSNAFYGCSNLMDVNFAGTISQWLSITKGTNWLYNDRYYTIHCTDGDIDRKGNIIS